MWQKIWLYIVKHKQIVAVIVAFLSYIFMANQYRYYYYKNVILQNDKNATFATFSDVITNESFYYSFIASSYEDIIFFAVIGIALFIFSLKRPEDEKLDNRINALFTNHHNVNALVSSHAKEELKKLAVYSTETYLEITILEKITHKEKELLKIGIDRKIHLTSIIHDLDNFTTNGKVEFYGEDKCELPNNIYGEINMIELMYDIDNIKTISTYEKMKDKNFIVTFKETFKKDSKLALHSNLWLWMLNGDIYEHIAYRTTSNMNISVKNNIEESIIITRENNKDIELHKDECQNIETDLFMKQSEIVSFKLNAKD